MISEALEDSTMNGVLWVLQILLAAAFFAHGWMFLFPPASVVEDMNATLPRWFQLFLGVAEVAAAFGLLLPGLTRRMPWLAWSSAVGIMIVMVSATVFHVVRNEMSSALITLILLVMATFVAYKRWRGVPIRSRQAA
jgi:uncharacterized membrane protein YphA (DoxX/SURF4 family)